MAIPAILGVALHPMALLPMVQASWTKASTNQIKIHSKSLKITLKAIISLSRIPRMEPMAILIKHLKGITNPVKLRQMGPILLKICQLKALQGKIMAKWVQDFRNSQKIKLMSRDSRGMTVLWGGVVGGHPRPRPLLAVMTVAARTCQQTQLSSSVKVTRMAAIVRRVLSRRPGTLRSRWAWVIRMLLWRNKFVSWWENWEMKGRNRWVLSRHWWKKMS